MKGLAAPGNPYGTGVPISQDSLKPVFERFTHMQEERARKRAANFVEWSKTQRTRAAEIAEKFRTAGLDLNSLRPDVATRRTGVTMPKVEHSHARVMPPNPFKSMAWTGSGGATRVPPYDYGYSWDWFTESRSAEFGPAFDPSRIVDYEEGYLEYGGAVFNNTLSSQKMIGIYVSPPNDGLLTFSSLTYAQGWAATGTEYFDWGQGATVTSSIFPLVWLLPSGGDFSPLAIFPFPFDGWSTSVTNNGNLFGSTDSSVTTSNGPVVGGPYPFGAATLAPWSALNIPELPSAPEPLLISMQTTFSVTAQSIYILWVCGISEVSNSSGFAAVGSVTGAFPISMSWSLVP